MPIICNTRCMNAPLTGVQRYTQKVLAGFPEKIKQIAPATGISRGIRGHLWEQFILPVQTRNKLLWSPSNSGPVNLKRQVVTVHDVVSADHPEWFNKAYVQWYNYMLPRLLKTADHIITISEFSRQRIVELFKIPESKITLIYNGADNALSEIKPGTPGIKLPFDRYILSLGSLEPRKNIPLLLEAWQSILNEIPEDIGLVIVGGKGNIKIFKDAGINQTSTRVYFTGHINDEQVSQLYRHTLLFAYLSVYEGFGLPPLEAMSAGIPVLTGNQTSLPEVVGDGGIMIDPYSLAECENGLVKLINNKGLRDRLAAGAILQATKFDWKETALKTWEVLQSFN
jgi:glycosyltransferase involved in cell wall biosynthesis